MIIIFILAILLILGSALFYLYYEEPYIFKITIYPTLSREGCYYFVLYEDSTLYCSSGRRRSIDIKDIRSKWFFEIKEESFEMKLTNEQVETLKQLANEIEKNGNGYPVKTGLGTMSVALFYNNEIYETNYYQITNDKLIEIIKEIILLSAIEVNITRGFS